MANATTIVMSELRVELMSLKKEKDIVIPGVIHRYDEQVFVRERIIDGGPLGICREICDELYKGKSFLSFRGIKM